MAILFPIIFFACHLNSLIIELSDMHTMAKNSDLVIHGYVGEQRVSYDDRGRLITLTDVEVVEGLHGAKSGEVITIYQVGGQKDGVVMPIIGGQKYILGQQMIFFGLKLNGEYVNYGAGQGKLDIIKETVKEDLGDVQVIKKDPKGRSRIFSPEPQTFPGVDDLKNEIKMMLQ